MEDFSDEQIKHKTRAARRIQAVFGVRIPRPATARHEGEDKRSYSASRRERASTATTATGAELLRRVRAGNARDQAQGPRREVRRRRALARISSEPQESLLRAPADEGKIGVPPTCVHPYYFSWAGRCEGCRLTPLSPNLPDPLIRGLAVADD